MDRTTMLGAGLLAALVVLPHFPLQATNYAIGTGVSFELCLRLVVLRGLRDLWLATCARSSRRLEKFPLAWCVLFGVWSMFSLLGAADLRVGTVACGVYWCVLVFLPAIVSQLRRGRTLLVLLASSMLYVVGQWALFLSGSELGFNVEASEAGEVFRLGGDSQELAFQAALLVGILLVLGRGRVPFNGGCSGLGGLTLARQEVGRPCSPPSWPPACCCCGRWHGGRRLLGLAAAATGCAGYGVVWRRLARMARRRRCIRVCENGNRGRNLDASGRAEIWPFVFGKIGKSPLLGHGYGCAGVAFGDVRIDGDPSVLRHAHNEFLNVVLCTGWFGGLLLAAMFLQQSLSRAVPTPCPITSRSSWRLPDLPSRSC